MRAGIAIDDWKLPIFERHLSEAGFAWKQSSGVTADTLLLFVECEFAADLMPIVSAANEEAAQKGKP